MVDLIVLVVINTKDLRREKNERDHTQHTHLAEPKVSQNMMKDTCTMIKSTVKEPEEKMQEVKKRLKSVIKKDQREQRVKIANDLGVNLAYDVSAISDSISGNREKVLPGCQRHS